MLFVLVGKNYLLVFVQKQLFAEKQLFVPFVSQSKAKGQLLTTARGIL